MSSQLNVDTIVDKAGSGGSNVKMANTSTYVSDGGGATQNTVQGLNKVWANLNGSSFGLRDSFNVTSATDNGAGDHTITIANDMGNGEYSVTTNAGDKNFSALGHVGINGASAPAAGSIRLGTTGSDGSNTDHTYVMIQIAGDLA